MLLVTWSLVMLLFSLQSAGSGRMLRRGSLGSPGMRHLRTKAYPAGIAAGGLASYPSLTRGQVRTLRQFDPTFDITYMPSAATVELVPVKRSRANIFQISQLGQQEQLSRADLYNQYWQGLSNIVSNLETNITRTMQTTPPRGRTFFVPSRDTTPEAPRRLASIGVSTEAVTEQPIQLQLVQRQAQRMIEVEPGRFMPEMSVAPYVSKKAIALTQQKKSVLPLFKRAHELEQQGVYTGLQSALSSRGEKTFIMTTPEGKRIAFPFFVDIDVTDPTTGQRVRQIVQPSGQVQLLPYGKPPFQRPRKSTIPASVIYSPAGEGSDFPWGFE